MRGDVVRSAAYAAIGTDGTRIIVWGTGLTKEETTRDARRWIREWTGARTPLELLPITLEQHRRILAGEISPATLGLDLALDPADKLSPRRGNNTGRR